MVDKKVSENKVEPSSTLTDCSPTCSSSACPPSEELLKQLQLAKYENETLRAHLANELGKLKKENEELKRKLDEEPAHTMSSIRETPHPSNEPPPNLSGETLLPDQWYSLMKWLRFFHHFPRNLIPFMFKWNKELKICPNFLNYPLSIGKIKEQKGHTQKERQFMPLFQILGE